MPHSLPTIIALTFPVASAWAGNNTDTNQLATLIITALIVVIVISQISRRKHKRGRLTLQLTQRELEQRIEERTAKLENSNTQLTQAINQHKATEALLTNTQDYLNSIINSMPSVLIGVNENCEVTFWNRAATLETRIDAEQAVGHDLFVLYPAIPVNRSTVLQTLRHKAPQLTENIRIGSGSQTRYLDVTLYPLQASQNPGAVIRVDDVSQRVKMENMVIQNEKMMSLGELAAGMAHEINNPLSAIINNVQNIQRRVSPDLEKNLATAERLGLDIKDMQTYLSQRGIFEFLDTIREAGDRSADIVTNMLEFSRSSNSNREATDLCRLLEDSLNLARNSFELKTADGKRSITLLREYEDNLPDVCCSKTEIQQVILNLLRNACQCFNGTESEKNSPQLTLRLYRWDDSLCLEIEDNGPGMSEEIRTHIFEPFFTTKDVGQGTGLGLSVTYFIVTEHHKGQIEVESTPGQGTNFIVTLPLDDAND